MSSALQNRTTGLVAVESTSLILLNLISLTGNILTCLAVYRNPKLRTTTNMYIIALAASDLSSALFVMPFSSGALIVGKWLYGDTYCKIQGFFVVLNIYVSPCLMALTAFNRYIRIVRTGVYHTLFASLRSLIWITVVWFVTASYILLQVSAGSQEIRFVSDYAVCSTVHKQGPQKIIHYSIVVPCFVVAPIIITSFCYYKIFRTLRRHKQNVATSLNKNGTLASKISRRELRVSLSLFVVVVVFALCWIPLWVLALLFRFQPVSLPLSVTLFISFLVFISSTINPFIYAGMNSSFRREFGNILSRKTNEETSSFHVRHINENGGNADGSHDSNRVCRRQSVHVNGSDREYRELEPLPDCHFSLPSP